MPPSCPTERTRECPRVSRVCRVCRVSRVSRVIGIIRVRRVRRVITACPFKGAILCCVSVQVFLRVITFK
jgi:hypothetical protein